MSRKNAPRVVAGKTAGAAAADVVFAQVANGSADSVALRAYLIYLEEGRPEGRHLEHWLRAEQELA